MLNLIPHFILENYKKNEFEGKFEAFVIFADICGFSKKTDELMQMGPEGAEVLSDILQRTFKPAVNKIYQYGGFITNFPGDALTALFQISTEVKEENQAAAILNCAFNILNGIKENGKLINKFDTLNPGIKIGISKGTVKWAITGDSNLSFYFKGEGIERSTECEKNARENEIVIDNNLFGLLDRSCLETEKINANYYLIKNTENFNFELNKGNETVQIPEITKQIFSKKFLPEAVINFSGHGEFRNAVSVFISFEGISTKKQLDTFFDLLIGTLDQDSGYLKEIEYADKGWVAACFFGAPLSFENNMERAANFVISLNKKAVTEKNLEKIKIKAGITSGRVYAGIIGGDERCQYSIVGNEVNLASRFMSKAAWGETLVSENIFQALNKNYDFLKLEKYLFKGFAEGIHSYKLLDPKKTDFTILNSAKMEGRENELEKIALFTEERIRKNESGLIYINGEAGIGKTRLINELEGRLNKDENIKWHKCISKETLMQPLLPFKQIVSEYYNYSENNTTGVNKKNFQQKTEELVNSFNAFNETEESVKAETINELRRTYSVLGAMLNLYWEGSLYENIDPKNRFENTLLAFYYLLKAETLLHAVILEFEDVQWLDSQSVEMLALNVQSLIKSPMVVICTSRNSNSNVLSSIKNSNVPVLEIELPALATENIKKLAENILGDKISPQLSEYLQNKTTGNPFFADQLVLDLKERGMIIKKGDVYELSEEKEFNVPETINNVLISRFDRLPAEIKEIIQSASTLGKEFDINLLCSICPEVKDFSNKVKKAEEFNIWSSTGETNYSFKHDLLKDAVYEMQMGSKLRDIHRRTADSILKIYNIDLSDKNFEEYSYHYGLGAGIINREYEIIIESKSLKAEETKAALIKFLKLQQELADRYDASYITNEALNKCRLVIQIAGLLNDKESLFDYTLKNGIILLFLGKYDEALVFLDRSLAIANETGDKIRIAHAYLNIGSASERRSNYKDAMEFFNKSMVIYREADDKAGIGKTASFLGSIYYYQGNFIEAMNYFEITRDMSASINDIQLKLKAIVNIAEVLRINGKFEESMKCFDQIQDILKSTKNKRDIAMTMGNLGLLYRDMRNDSEAMKCYEEQTKISEELGDKREIIKAYNNTAVYYIDAGNFKGGLEIYNKVLILSNEIADKYGLSGTLGNIGVIYKETGDYIKALNYFEKAITIAEERGFKSFLLEFLNAKSDILCSLSRFEEAKEINSEGANLANELLSDEFIIKYKIQKAILDFYTSDRKKSIAELTSMIDSSTKEEHTAEIHYTLFQLLYEKEDDIMSREKLEYHRKTALDLFKKINNEAPLFAYEKRIETLSKQN